VNPFEFGNRLLPGPPTRSRAGGPRADTRPARLARLKARRRLWLKVHLWLGLTLGLVLSVVGLSGSLLVFWQEIDDWLDPELCVVAPPPEGRAGQRPFPEALEAAGSALPAGAVLRFVHFPRDERTAYLFDYALDDPAGGGSSAWQVGVDPYTAKITGKRLVQGSGAVLPAHFTAFVFRLHDSLLAGDTGALLVGVAAAALIFSVLTGLILWWPLAGRWRRVFVIKRGAGPERFNHDLHQTAGFYTFLVLLVLLLSGLYMNLPEQFVGLVQGLSPGTRYEEPEAPPAEGRTPIDPAQALALAEQRHPGGRTVWLRPPRGERGVYTVTRMDVPGLGPFWPQRKIFLDPYGGELEVRDPATRRTAGDAFLEWQWPLHSGRVFGWPGRILVFLTGLAAPLLFATGLIRWLQKRRARRHRRPTPPRTLHLRGL
jgi:uncharacterized iron-regulated membrane protein